MSDSNYDKNILECLLIFSITLEASIIPGYIIIFMFLLLSDNRGLLVIHSNTGD